MPEAMRHYSQAGTKLPDGLRGEVSFLSGHLGPRFLKNFNGP